MFDWNYDPDFIGPTYPKAVIMTTYIGLTDDPKGALLPIIQIDPAGFNNGASGKKDKTTYYHVPLGYCMEGHADYNDHDCRGCRGFYFNTDTRFVTDGDGFVCDCIYVWHPGDIAHARLLGHKVEDVAHILAEDAA